MGKRVVIGVFAVLAVVLVSGCVKEEPVEPEPVQGVQGDCLVYCPDGTSVLCGQECLA